jgi:hypothetical protein
MSEWKKEEKNINTSKILGRLWASLHIISQTYDPHRDKHIDVSFKCFMYSVIKLLPFRSHKLSIEFIEKYPIDNYLGSSIKTFQWTYLWHDYINMKLGKDRITLAEAKKMYKLEDISKDQWGPRIWILIHTLAKYLPANPSTELKQIYYDMLKCLKLLLPCSKCRSHLTKHLSEYDFTKYFTNRDTIFLFTNILHNVVNVSLNRRQLSVEDAWILY